MKIKRFGACILAAAMLCGSLPVYAEEIGETEKTMTVETPAETVWAESTEPESESIPVSEAQEEETNASETETEAQTAEEPVTVETEEEKETEKLVEETEEKEDEASADPVEDFVRRLYTKALNRKADASGLKDWTNLLKSKQKQGAEVAQGFIDSNEFKARKLSNKDYITVSYRTFFDREPDSAGLKTWMEALDDGLSRLYVFKGFAESKEFSDLCSKYGIIRGNAALTAPMDQNGEVTKFVVRCYRLCLDREPDTSGLNEWCQWINSGTQTAKQAAYGFIFSSEFKNKSLSNEEYVKILYRVFMDREADASGLQTWKDCLENGSSRVFVFEGFADSVEFQGICNRYNVNSGAGIRMNVTPELVTSAPIMTVNNTAYCVRSGVPGTTAIPFGSPLNGYYIFNMAYYNGQVYFTCKTPGTSEFSTAFYRCNLDGSNMQQLASFDKTQATSAMDFYIYANRLYYGRNNKQFIDLSSGGRGTDSTLYNELGSTRAFCIGDNMYYVYGSKYIRVLPEVGETISINVSKVNKIAGVGEDCVYYEYYKGNYSYLERLDLSTLTTTLMDSHRSAGGGYYFNY